VGGGGGGGGMWGRILTDIKHFDISLRKMEAS